MKTLVLTLGLMAACVRAGYAVEYVTLLAGETIDVSPTSLVENVGPNAYCTFKFSRMHTEGIDYTFPSGTHLTGLTQIKYTGNMGIFASLRITKAEEINSAGPTSLLVIPENSTGNYNIVVETSSDTATWTPFHSQTVSANDAKRFFRTCIVKAE